MTGRRTCGILLVLLCLTPAGCNTKLARAKVKGQVKIGDKLANSGSVTFITKDGNTGTGIIDANGNYEVGNAPVGDVTITVTAPRMRGFMSGNNQPPKGMPEMKPPDGSGGGGPPKPTIDPSKIIPINEKYETAEKSPLKYKVEKGEQTHDLLLEP